MTIKFFVLSFIAILLLTQPLALMAQDVPESPGWTAVQAVPLGDELTVEMKNGNQVKGKLSNISDATLTLVRRNKPVNIDRTVVLRVYRLSGGRGSRAKSALIGAGVGAGVGIGAALVGLYAIGSGSDQPAPLIASGGLIVAGIGAALGGIAGGGRKRTIIYKAR